MANQSYYNGGDVGYPPQQPNYNQGYNQQQVRSPPTHPRLQ
jgi:hypothetical protein